MPGLLPPEARTLLAKIPHAEQRISTQVERVLVKLWSKQEPSPEELDLEIEAPEVAAVWSIKHGRAISSDTPRQVLRRQGKRNEAIEAAQEWGEKYGVRRRYRLGDIVDITVQERPSRTKKTTDQQ